MYREKLVTKGYRPFRGTRMLINRMRSSIVVDAAPSKLMLSSVRFGNRRARRKGCTLEKLVSMAMWRVFKEETFVPRYSRVCTETRLIVMDRVCSAVDRHRKLRRGRMSRLNGRWPNVMSSEVRLERGHLGMRFVVEIDWRRGIFQSVKNWYVSFRKCPSASV